MNVEKHEARLKKEETEKKKHKFRKGCRRFFCITMISGAICILATKIIPYESELLNFAGALLIEVGVIAGILSIDYDS